jgi:hypothetical protein
VAYEETTKRPRLLLEFERPYWVYTPSPRPTRAIRPVDVAAVLTTLEAIYLVTALAIPPPEAEQGELEWVREQKDRLRVKALRMESPLQILLEVPWPIHAAAFGSLAYGVSYVLGVPYRASARFHRAREEYFESRTAASGAKERWLDRKAETAKRSLHFKLSRVAEVSQLPPHDDDEDERFAD